VGDTIIVVGALEQLAAFKGRTMLDKGMAN